MAHNLRQVGPMRLTPVLVLILACCFDARSTPVQLGSAYGYTFGYGNATGQCSYCSYVYIDGPNGTETYSFNFNVDIFRDAHINQFGEVAGALEATADPGVYYAIYGHTTGPSFLPLSDP